MDSKNFVAEASTMKDLKHSKVIQLYAVCTLEEPFCIITELMRDGRLLDFLKSPRGQQLKLNVLVDMAAQISSGMTYLETNNYIHRDLAARNVLVTENHVCKIVLTRVIKVGV